MQDIIQQLLKLSHDLGREDRGLAILGEGNTSARVDGERFLVKASGSTLATLSESDLTLCSFERILALFDLDSLSDEQVDDYLLNSRLLQSSRKPSVETLFHAWLLTLPGVNFVGHTHSVAVNQILCSPRAEEFAKKRLFPDEIVCCGSATVFINYTDPGIELARAVRSEVEKFLSQRAELPSVILIENHGIITLGATPQAVLAAMLMADKAARIFSGAAALGGPKFLSESQVKRISMRPDEKYRRETLRI
jgi:rhamnose utilization protein RhaD (predicted bifunctional aldolase and dehydrogenase)